MAATMERFLEIMANRKTPEQGITTSDLAEHMECELQSVYNIVSQARNEGHDIKGVGRPQKYFLGDNSNPRKKTTKAKSSGGYDKVLTAYKTLVNEAEFRKVSIADVLTQQEEKLEAQKAEAEKAKREKAIERIKTLAKETGLSVEDLQKELA